MPGSLRIGTIAGIDIFLHVSWLIILVLLTWSLATRALEFTRSASIDCQRATARLPQDVHSNVSFVLQHF